MRVTKEKSSENRALLLDAAAKLFRRHGIAGVGVADIAKEAGLTHGALYAHFASKDTLAAESLLQACVSNLERAKAWATRISPSFRDVFEAMTSKQARDDWETACPMAASASEIGRQSAQVSASFARGFEDLARLLESSLGKTMSKSKRRRLALAAVSAEVGAIAVSRAVLKTDPKLSAEILEAVRSVFLAASSDD